MATNRHAHNLRLSNQNEHIRSQIQNTVFKTNKDSCQAIKATPNSRLLPTSLRLWSKEYYQVKWLQRVQELLGWEALSKIKAKFILTKIPLEFAGNYSNEVESGWRTLGNEAAQWWSWGGRRNINLLVRKLSKISRIPGINRGKYLVINTHSSQYYGQNPALNPSHSERCECSFASQLKFHTSCTKCFRGSGFEFGKPFY